MGYIHLMVITTIFFPLLGSLLTGLGGNYFTKKIVVLISLSLLFIATLTGFFLFYHFYSVDVDSFEYTLYSWCFSGKTHFEIGFLIDRLTTLMFVVVLFVSFMVHVYTIGYMEHDKGFKKFFCYISFFTFAMLMLVGSNNFLQLFFGWEAVGLASYLLIGFWHQRDTAIFANLKAFIVNRVGDFGFLLGIAGIFFYFQTLNYIEVFKQVGIIAGQNLTISIFSGCSWSVVTIICVCIFIGAMGKSAQIPLHIWLPDSMEGPTPISALIHAATMVTAGIFMTTRMSPLFEYSTTALSFVLITGTLTCFFMGLLGIVQNDIKRVIAYSTLSQLGLMVAALGVSSYATGMFHLMTHAFFKALLFLGAGAVIIGMHHKQDIRDMGNLKKYMPITYITMLIGSLALIGFPGTAGFFSKDLILESLHFSTLSFAKYAYYIVYVSVFITSFYSFRLFFLVFHTKERMLEEDRPTEVDSVVYVPLVLLAIPSLFVGYIFTGHVLDFYFTDSVFLLNKSSSFFHVKHEFTTATSMFLHGIFSGPCVLGYSGIFLSWFLYVFRPSYVDTLTKKFSFIYFVLKNKYWFDSFNLKVLVPFVISTGNLLYNVGDRFLIDGLIVNGSANIVKVFAQNIRRVQTGYVYHYVFVLLFFLFLFLLWLVFKP